MGLLSSFTWQMKHNSNTNLVCCALTSNYFKVSLCCVFAIKIKKIIIISILALWNLFCHSHSESGSHYSGETSVNNYYVEGVETSYQSLKWVSVNIFWKFLYKMMTHNFPNRQICLSNIEIFQCIFLFLIISACFSVFDIKELKYLNTTKIPLPLVLNIRILPFWFLLYINEILSAVEVKSYVLPQRNYPASLIFGCITKNLVIRTPFVAEL